MVWKSKFELLQYQPGDIIPDDIIEKNPNLKEFCNYEKEIIEIKTKLLEDPIEKEEKISFFKKAGRPKRS